MSSDKREMDEIKSRVDTLRLKGDCRNELGQPQPRQSLTTASNHFPEARPTASAVSFYAARADSFYGSTPTPVKTASKELPFMDPLPRYLRSGPKVVPQFTSFASLKAPPKKKAVVLHPCYSNGWPGMRGMYAFNTNRVY
jgi:hypothetical protein